MVIEDIPNPNAYLIFDVLQNPPFFIRSKIQIAYSQCVTLVLLSLRAILQKKNPSMEFNMEKLNLK